MQILNKPLLSLDASLVQDNIPIEVIPKIFIGSIHAAFNEEALHELGITHILNASRLPPSFPKLFTYLSIDLRDKESSNILSCIPATNIFIESAIEAGGVLIHCFGGRSRSAAFIAAYIISCYSMSYADTLEMIKAKRAVVNINKGFELQLTAYAEAQCNIYLAQQLLLFKRIYMLKRYRGQSYLYLKESGQLKPKKSFKNNQKSGHKRQWEDVKKAVNEIETNATSTIGIAMGYNDDNKGSNEENEYSSSSKKTLCTASNKTFDYHTSSESKKENYLLSVITTSNNSNSENTFPIPSPLPPFSPGRLSSVNENWASSPRGVPLSSKNNASKNTYSLNSELLAPEAVKPSLTFTTSLELASNIELNKTPYCRLSTPGSQSVRVIPPLRGLEKSFCCSWCQQVLFCLANVVRLDLTEKYKTFFDQLALDLQNKADDLDNAENDDIDELYNYSDYIDVSSMKHSTHAPSPPKSSLKNVNKFKMSLSATNDDTRPMQTPAAAPRPRGVGSSKKSFTFDSFDTDMEQSTNSLRETLSNVQATTTLNIGSIMNDEQNIPLSKSQESEGSEMVISYDESDQSFLTSTKISSNADNDRSNDGRQERHAVNDFVASSDNSYQEQQNSAYDDENKSQQKSSFWRKPADFIHNTLIRVRNNIHVSSTSTNRNNFVVNNNNSIHMGIHGINILERISESDRVSESDKSFRSSTEWTIRSSREGVVNKNNSSMSSINEMNELGMNNSHTDISQSNYTTSSTASSSSKKSLNLQIVTDLQEDTTTSSSNINNICGNDSVLMDKSTHQMYDLNVTYPVPGSLHSSNATTHSTFHSQPQSRQTSRRNSSRDSISSIFSEDTPYPIPTPSIHHNLINNANAALHNSATKKNLYSTENRPLTMEKMRWLERVKLLVKHNEMSQSKLTPASNSIQNLNVVDNPLPSGVTYSNRNTCDTRPINSDDDPAAVRPRIASNSQISKLADEDDDATSNALGLEKFIYLEYMKWMGLNMFEYASDSGEIHCFNCHKMIGVWTWQPNEKQSHFGKLISPLIRIHKKAISGTSVIYDSTPACTPRQKPY